MTLLSIGPSRDRAVVQITYSEVTGCRGEMFNNAFAEAKEEDESVVECLDFMVVGACPGRWNSSLGAEADQGYDPFGDLETRQRHLLYGRHLMTLLRLRADFFSYYDEEDVDCDDHVEQRKCLRVRWLEVWEYSTWECQSMDGNEWDAESRFIQELDLDSLK